MKAILFVAIFLAAITTIASGIWVAASLLTAISPKGHPRSSLSREHVES